PCIGSRLSVFRISMSSVPWMTSVLASSMHGTIRPAHVDCQDVAINRAPLPAERVWKELAGQVFVVAAQLVEAGPVVALRIQVVPVESADPFHERAVLVVAKVVVLAFAVPGIEGVIPDHVERFDREAILHDVIQVLVVSPRQMDVLQTAPALVN